MSDKREEAQQELIEAGMAGGMEDTLGASLSSSFSPAPKTNRKEVSDPTIGPSGQPTQAALEQAPAESPKIVKGMEEWKDTYDNYVSHWQAESSEARAKALATRLRIEKEREDAKASETEAQKAKKRAEEKERKDAEKAEKLRSELAAEAKSGRKGNKSRGGDQKEQREQKVKEAWEMVKGAGEKEGVEHIGDARGVMEEDLQAGQATSTGQDRPKIKPTAYDPTTSTEPLPPSMQPDTPSPTYPMPSESQTLSRHSATSGAWEEISAPSSAADISSPPSTSSNELLSVPQSKSTIGKSLTDPVPSQISPSGLSQPDLQASGGSGSGDPRSSPTPSGPAGKGQNSPPAQPPSLTLSLFTMPSHLSFGRVMAVLGINMVLPFINGVMLGFGEIFAREVFKVGRMVYYGERSWFRSEGDTSKGKDNQYAGGKGVAGVGLSGSGGFP